MRKGYVSALVLASALCIPATASAVPIAPTNLDVWIVTAGAIIAGPTVDTFDTVNGDPANIGSLENFVYFNDTTGEYTYTHGVTAAVNNISEFNTGFSVRGFTGTAGFSFSESGAAGGTGTAADFEIELDEDGTIDWETVHGLFNWFDAGDTVTFFFVSTLPPATGSYNLINSAVGTAESFAPIPEPGSMALLGSGLLSLYGVARRRRNARA